MVEGCGRGLPRCGMGHGQGLRSRFPLRLYGLLPGVDQISGSQRGRSGPCEAGPFCSVAVQISEPDVIEDATAKLKNVLSEILG